jgi:lipoyl(octanoyl) transferase
MPKEPEWFVSPTPIAYPEAIETMESRVDDIIERTKPELIWMLQHPPLYTAGTSSDIKELKDVTRFPVFEAGRGGRYTYHGPGQRVIYAMIDLRERGQDLRAHVWRLEEWIIRVLADFKVKAERREGRIGLWVTTGDTEEKVAAIGVRIRKWVAYHGLSLNIDPDLSHFSGIVPCGISEFGVTSLHKLGKKVTMSEIDAAFKRHINIVLS